MSETPEEKLPQQTQPTPRVEKSFLKAIRTFQGDVAETLHKQKESIFSIRQSALKKDPEPQREVESNSNAKRILTFAIGSILLLVLTLIGGYYTYAEFLRKSAPPIPAVPESRFISAESSTKIDANSLTREEIFAKIQEASGGVKTAELKHIMPLSGTTTEMTTEKFMTALGTNAPGNLIRAFDPTFMLGTLGNSRFLILKLASFNNAFSGMLSWEKNIAQDLSGLFANKITLQSIGPTAVFRDVVHKNKDLRALFSSEKTSSSTPQIVLLYSFFDSQILIITDRPETLQTVIGRLNREKLSR